MKRERNEVLVIKMPDEADLYIAALAVVESFIYMASHGEGYWTGSFHLENVNKLYQNLLPMGFRTLRVQGVQMYEGPSMIKEASVRLDLDGKRAYEISVPTQTHAVIAFGLMMGSEPENAFPNFKPPIITDKINHVLVIESPAQEGLWEYRYNQQLRRFLSELPSGIQVSNQDLSNKSLKEILEIVTEVEMVIGYACAGTYLAACMKKAVVELYPEYKYHRGWLSKYGAGPYYMVPMPISTEQTFLNALETAWAMIAPLKA